MKKKNNGFIATSLIYSFFLVFIAVIAALLNSYIANKTIMDRFNTTVTDELNTKSYTLTVYSTNSNIQDGMTLTNLVLDGEFKSMRNWSKVGGALFTPNVPWLNNSSIQREDYGSRNSYIYQDIHFLGDSKYYCAVDYIHTLPAYSPKLYSYVGSLDMTPNRHIETLDSQGLWTKGSYIYNSNYDGMRRFVVGDSYNNAYSGTDRFSNAMVINLTASFGKGYEPDPSWIDANIDWFDGTISYRRIDKINSGEDVSVRFALFTGYERPVISCRTDSNVAVSPAPTYYTETRENRRYGVVNIKSIKNNVKCNIDWRP